MIRIPDWTPPSENKSVGRHYAVLYKAKRAAADMLGVYAHLAGVKLVDPPGYAPRRRVTLAAFYPKSQGRLPDPSNLIKALFDSLKLARLIVDDSDKWLDWDKPKVSHSQDEHPRTVITVCDLTPGREPWPPREPSYNPSQVVYTTADGERINGTTAPRPSRAAKARGRNTRPH